MKDIKDRELKLEIIGDTYFAIRRYGLSIVFWWERETAFKNFVWVRTLSIGIQWPPILYNESFVEI